MSRRTIRLVDLYCRAANWNSSVPEVDDHRPSHWTDEARSEAVRWNAKRDKAIEKIRRLTADLTEHEKDWIRRRCGGAGLADKFRALGIEPNWL